MSFGTGVSSRNSEVIHAGIYYPRGSLKALSMRGWGATQLYEYCEIARGSASTVRQADRGDVRGAAERAAIRRGLRGQWRGASDVVAVRGAGAGAGARMCRAPCSRPAPASWIRMRTCFRCWAKRSAAGLSLRSGSWVTERELEGDGIRCSGERWRDRAAGEGAGELRGAWGRRMWLLVSKGFLPGFMRRGYLAKGSYFTLAGRSPFSRLVYPVPEPGGLGFI